MPLLRYSTSLFQSPSRNLRDHIDSLYNAGLYLTGNHTHTQKLIVRVLKRKFFWRFLLGYGKISRRKLLRSLWVEYQRRQKESLGLLSVPSVDPGKLGGTRFSADTTSQIRSQRRSVQFDEIISSTSAPARFAVILVDIEKLSYREAASIMRCSIPWLKSYLRRGREAYRELVVTAIPVSRSNGK